MLYFISIGETKSGLTRAAEKKIAEADYCVFRTVKTLAAKGLRYDMSFDDLYEKSADFDELNRQCADKLAELDGQYDSVAYVTDDAVDDEVCRILYRRGVKFEMTGLGICPPVPVSAYIKLSAYDLGIRPYLDTSMAVLIHSADNAFKAAEVKLYLMKFYDFSQPVIMTRGGKSTEMTLEDIDRQKTYDYSTTVFIPAIEGYDKKKSGFGDLMRIIARLTAPDGCPWDKEQTHESIRANMIEEAYEAVDAVNSGDIDAMIEEFGDVILQSVLNSDIAERGGEFDISDVLTALCAKLYTRHTHIFGADRAENAGQALGYWEAAKSKEKNYVSLEDKLNRIPEDFPALLKMQKIISKTQKAGYDFGDAKSQIQNLLKEEDPDLGELLFLCVLMCKQRGVDAETELTATARKIKEKISQQK